MEKLSLFKLGVLLLGTAFIVIMFIYSQALSKYVENGRYYFVGVGYGRIIDTRTGVVYRLKSESENKGMEKLNDPITK
jgi:hypothetical protein